MHFFAPSFIIFLTKIEREGRGHDQQRCHDAAQPPPVEPPPEKPPKAPPPAQPLGFLSGILDRLHLGDIDTGDLLLLLLLFHLFREGGDEELLIAVGLLLIL